MVVHVDSVGRLVIPKALRTALGITPETPLELALDGGGLRLQPMQSERRQIEEKDGLLVLAAVPGSIRTDDDVRRLRDELQR